HTHGSFEYRAYNGMIKAASGDQLADEHALVDQRNVEITGNELAIAILDLAWIGNDALQALQLEIFGKHPEFAVAGHFAPVENCDARRFTVADPLLVGVHQGMEDAVARRQWAHLIAAQELAHHEQAELGTEVGILYGGVIGFVEGVQQYAYSRLQEAILFRRYEARSQNGA